MNVNLFGHNGQWLIVDCGITFNEPLIAPYRSDFIPDSELHELVTADPQFILDHLDLCVGIVVTHAHEDHVGAIPFLWRQFQLPVYTTGFTAEVLERKLRQFGLSGQVPIHQVQAGQTHQIGNFEVQWLAITHSIPEPCALTIKTDCGKIFHSADWKIDYQPGVGKPFKERAFKNLGQQDILAMLCDSTNALKSGTSISEHTCYLGLKHYIKQAQGSVVVSCFSSNIARLLAIGQIAKETGRVLTFFGRSLKNMVSIAQTTGYWDTTIPVASEHDLHYLLPHEILIVATGSQGEPRAALSKMAQERFHFKLNKQDTILFSSMIIPGNEEPIAHLVDQLRTIGCTVIQAHEAEHPIHASGHPCEDELKQLYSWVQPRIAIPVHGEPEHIERNAQIAAEVGVPQQFKGVNGDLYILSPEPGIIRQAVQTGRISLRYGR